MGENARKRLAAALGGDAFDDVMAQQILAADPQLEADIELGAALNSDKAERVLASALTNRYAIYMNSEWRADARAILAALREGLRRG